MSDKSNLDWLYSEDLPDFSGTKVRLSEGGSDFSNAQIGEWTIGTLWKLTTPTDINLNELGHATDGNKVAPFGNMWYFKEENYEKAVAASKAIQAQYGPQHVWHFRMPTSTFLNFNGKDKSASEIFGDEIDFDVKIASLGALKSRNEFHFLMLPSLVQEMAIVRGWLKERIYDYSKLPNDPTEDMNQEAKLERQNRLVGGDKDWLDSELGKARKAIWAALGEENCEAYTVKTPDGKTKKFVVESDKLKKLLWVVYSSTPITLWAKMVRVISPAADAVSQSSHKHFTTYVCCGIYKSKADAQVEVPQAEAAADDGMPFLPIAWQGSTKQEFIDYANDFLVQKKLKGKPVMVVQNWFQKNAQEWLDASGATVDETVSWLPFMSL